MKIAPQNQPESNAMSKKTLLAFIGRSGKTSDIKPVIDWVQSHDWHLKQQVLGVALPSPVYSNGVPPGGGKEIGEAILKRAVESGS